MHHFDRIDAAIVRLESLLADAGTASPPDAGSSSDCGATGCWPCGIASGGPKWSGSRRSAPGRQPIPPYVREAEADALLALRRPDEARVAYKEVLTADASRIRARVGLFFALLEGERLGGALAVTDAMAAEGGAEDVARTSTVPAENGDWLDAQALAAIAHYYVGQSREAWRRLQPLVDGAPALSFLRSAKAEIAAARGWPRLADEETHIAAMLAPPERSTEIALADAALARKRFDEARQRTSTLITLFPDDQAVERLRRSVRSHDAPELRLDSQSRTEQGNAADRPGSGYDVRSRCWRRRSSNAGA